MRSEEREERDVTHPRQVLFDGIMDHVDAHSLLSLK